MSACAVCEVRFALAHAQGQLHCLLPGEVHCMTLATSPVLGVLQDLLQHVTEVISLMHLDCTVTAHLISMMVI